MYTIHDTLFNFWNSSQFGSVTVQQLIDALPSALPANAILCQHYFIDNGAGGISPTWDFRATPEFEGIADAVFVGKSLANISDADATQNVPWLHLGKVAGDVADEVYRIFTVGGVPPPSVSFPSLSGIAGAFAVDPVDGHAYAFFFYSVSVGRRRIFPSNMFPNIGSLEDPWGWGPSDNSCYSMTARCR